MSVEDNKSSLAFDSRLKAAAEAYWNQGLSVVLMTVLEDGKKDVLHTWKQWETRRQTREEFDALPWLNAERFAVVCGVQGINGLYFTPIDTDNPDFDQNLLRVTQTERTPRGGHHFIYWSRVNTRGKKLHDLKIELLGQGNLCLMCPSKDYVKVNDNPPTEIDNIKEVFERLTEKLGGHTKRKTQNNRIRYCCREALARDNHIDHLMRLAIASEYKRAGYSNEDIVQLFKSQDDYDHDKCLVQAKSADPLKAATCETIKEYGYCYPECQENCIETKNRAPLADYGFEIHKLKNKVYVLTKTGEADPLSTFSSLTSSLSKKAVADITKAPITVVEKAFAFLAVRLSAKTEAKNETETTKEEEKFSEETTREAWQLLRSPSLFYDIGPVFDRGFEVPKINKTRFVLGEERNKRLLGPLLTGASILSMTSLIRVIGEPGTAKDTLVRMWLKLLGIEYLERSYLTAAAIRYSPNIKNVDLLYIPDTPKMQGETGRTLLFMRSDDGGLISEYATRDSETGKMTTETVTLPIKGVVTTSIEVIAGAALTSGMWTLTTDADLKLTESVKKEKLKLRAGKHGLLPDKDLDVWRCAFKILRTEELLEDPIIIEYAGNLDKIISSERSESRRDPDKLCDLICLVAWMRRFQKAEEDRGKADFTDLYIALQIGKDAIRETMSGLSAKEQKILDALIVRIAPLGLGVTIREISEETKIAHKTVYNILEQSLLEKGYATVEKEGNRNYYKYLTGKSGKSSPFSEGSNELKSDEIITFVSDVIGHYSLDNGNPCERIILVDPVTGEQVTFERDGENVTGKAEPSKKFTPTGIDGERSNGEPSPTQAPTAEQTTKTLLPAETGDENCFLCLKPMPSDLADTTFYHGKRVHCVCALRLEARDEQP